ncbi:hypothetical protein RE628_28690 [Paenibacillus sp. D2_2]|uniref:NHL domain-containing protein n=1 Tax=Paenibacillus sp. D2_2 TaxID=3073092 RepID=UPI002816577B|nr:hypothetical protein [Paenibacillus sp. D2_2]WMT40993.1 hypothetical protein RE628_28690 [Paenibacillus sp. D2_2]
MNFDSEGNLYFEDAQKIRKLTTDGQIVTLAGQGTMDIQGIGPATSAQLDHPEDVVVDANNNLYISDPGNHRVMEVYATNGRMIQYAGTEIQGDTQVTYARASHFNRPSGLAVRGVGSLYIADSLNHRVRSTVPVAYGAMMTSSYGAGNGTSGFSGDGGYSMAGQLNSPSGMAIDPTSSSQDYYIADTVNNRIRKVTGNTSNIMTYAGNGTAGYTGDGGSRAGAQLNAPRGVAVDSQGNVYIADTGNHVVRKVAKATGIITTFAGSGEQGYNGDGGQASSAQLSSPWDLAFDKYDNLYITDTGNHAIRRVDLNGSIMTVAGNGEAGFSGEGTSALTAKLNSPTGIFVTSKGEIYIADRDNNRVRKVVQQTIAKASASITSHITGNAQSVAVTVNTFGVVDGSAVTVQLVDGKGNAVADVKGTGSIANNSAVVNVTIPAAVNGGQYRFKVQVSGLAEEKRIDYRIKLFPADHADLHDLAVNGATIAGFAKDTLEYDVELPFGTIEAPTVTAASEAEDASAVVTPAVSLPGTTTIVVTAEDGTTTKTYHVNFTLALNPAKAITGFVFDGLSPTVEGTVDEATKTVAVTVPYGTDVTNISPTIVHTGATLSPENGVTQDFSSPVTYTVTAADGSTANYVVTVTIGDPSTNADLSNLTVDGITINDFASDTTTYDVVLPYGTTEVPIVDVTVHDKGKANAVVAPATDLPGTTMIVVTAEDGTTTKTYQLNFTVALNTAKEITGFRFDSFNPTVTGTVYEDARTITIIVPYGTDLTNLSPTIIHTGATLSPASGEAQDFLPQ